MSEEKNQAESLNHLLEINKALVAKNEALQKSNLALEKKIGQLKEFAGIITHDVRGPAHNIHKIMEMHSATNDPEIKQAALDYLKKLSADLNNNLNELIQVLQIHLEKDIPTSLCNFQEITESVLIQLQDLIREKNAQIQINFELTNIQYPRIFLQSIVYNLLSNSLKYSRPGIEPEIEIHSFSKGEHQFLTVKDNGLGIDLNRFGKQLFKFQKSFHSGFESKGIGLYLIKNQIEDQGGSISAISEPNKGTIFTVQF
jgi:light-regulated signal transduction histidine kinase (bacteriophytochrome)